MPTQAEFFNGFPNKGHVVAVCKPEQDLVGCRYISSTRENGRTVYHCERASELRMVLDNRAITDDFLGRNNCLGTLGFIIDNQNLLVGCRLVSHRNGEEDVLSSFQGIEMRDGVVEIAGFSAPEKCVEINVTSEGITFKYPNLETATVLFEEPEPIGS